MTTLTALRIADQLRQLEPEVGRLDRAALRERLAPILERLQQGIVPGESRSLVDEAVTFCRGLFEKSRSAEAIPLALGALATATSSGDSALIRRIATVAGLVSADAGDLVAGIDHHMLALRLAREAGDDMAVAMVWNNVGNAMSVAANHDLAARCYMRALAALDAVPQSQLARQSVCSNLANSYYQIEEHDEGLVYARLALSQQTQAVRDQDVLGAAILQRNVTRLLVAKGDLDAARRHADECVALARAAGTDRAFVAAALAQASHEMATGHSDLALTRLEGALRRARAIPAAFRDTLYALVCAEEAAGNVERALLRLEELAEHTYRDAVASTRAHMEIASLLPTRAASVEAHCRQAQARLSSKVAAPAPPESWRALDRLAVTAVMRMEPTGRHGKRVGALVKALALREGTNPILALEMGLAAELHDIGMTSVPEEILRKRSPLSAGERAIIRKHIEAGAEMLRDDRQGRVFMAREMAAYHHARWDGEGYPAGIGGTCIPLGARACAVAEAYDAMVCGIGNKPRKTMDEALAELRRHAGRQFDPRLVESFDGLIRAETQDLGLDLASDPSVEGFQELVTSLQEDRGFL